MPLTPEQLDMELARARSDRGYVGWAMAKYRLTRKAHRLPESWAGLDADALAALELRRRPRSDQFEADVRRLARETGCRMRWLLTVCRAAAAAELIEAGVGVSQIADKVGLTPRRVWMLRGVRRSKPRVTDADRARIAELLAAGKSRRDVVKLTGRCRKVVDAVAAAKS